MTCPRGSPPGLPFLIVAGVLRRSQIQCQMTPGRRRPSPLPRKATVAQTARRPVTPRTQVIARGFKPRAVRKGVRIDEEDPSPSSAG